MINFIRLFILFVLFIIGFSVFFIYGFVKTEVKNENLNKELPKYCDYLKSIEFKGEIINIKKSYDSGGAPDMLIVKCSCVDFSNDSIMNNKFIKINDSILQIPVNRIYTRTKRKIHKGDSVICNKGENQISCFAQGKEKIFLNIRINGNEINCKDCNSH